MRKSSVQLLFHVFEQAKCCPVSAKLNSRILGSTRSPVLNGLSQKTQTHRLPPKDDATRDHVSRLMPPSYFPRASPQLQRFLRANSFHATAISSPNSASPPLQHRNRGYKEPRFRLSRRLRSSSAFHPSPSFGRVSTTARQRIRGWNCCVSGKPRKSVIVSE